MKVPCGLAPQSLALSRASESARDFCHGLLVFQAGPYTASKACGVPPGQRFITTYMPDLTEAFACLARSGDAAGGS